MNYAKRSLEELFSLFIASTLTIEAIKATFRMLHRAFLPHCLEGELPHLPPGPPIHPPPPPPAGIPPHLPPHLDPLNCNRSVGIIFILLMLGTAWLALTLANFRKTAFLGKRKREIISDYALPLAVCAMALVANFMFEDIPREFKWQN
jgi:solute carrier family 4 (sodium borate transporter), member 11